MVELRSAREPYEVRSVEEQNLSEGNDPSAIQHHRLNSNNVGYRLWYDNGETRFNTRNLDLYETWVYSQRGERPRPPEVPIYEYSTQKTRFRTREEVTNEITIDLMNRKVCTTPSRIPIGIFEI